MPLTGEDYIAEFGTSRTVHPWKIPNHHTRTVWGIPNCVMRLRTAHFTSASVRCVARFCAQSCPPNNLLNRNIVFSAMFWRVHPLNDDPPRGASLLLDLQEDVIARSPPTDRILGGIRLRRAPRHEGGRGPTLEHSFIARSCAVGDMKTRTHSMAKSA